MHGVRLASLVLVPASILAAHQPGKPILAYPSDARLCEVQGNLFNTPLADQDAVISSPSRVDLHRPVRSLGC